MTVSMKTVEVGQIVAMRPPLGGGYRRHPSTVANYGFDSTAAAFKSGLYGVPAIVLGVDKWIMVAQPCGKVPQTHESAKRSILVAYPVIDGHQHVDEGERNEYGISSETPWAMAVVTSSQLEDWDLWTTLREALKLSADDYAVRSERFQEAHGKYERVVRQYEAAIHKATIAHFEAIMESAIPSDFSDEYGTKVHITRGWDGVTIKVPSRLAAKLVNLDDTETWEANIAEAKEARRVAEEAMTCKPIRRH